MRLMGRRSILAMVGYASLGALSGNAALRIVRRRPFDLVIIDPFLPDLSGLEVAAKIKKLKPQIPIVLLIDREGLPAGAKHADLVLKKDTDMIELLAMIEKLISRPHAVPKPKRKRPRRRP